MTYRNSGGGSENEFCRQFMIYVGTENELMHQTAYKHKNAFDTGNYFYIQLTSNTEKTFLLG